jgi:transposase
VSKNHLSSVDSAEFFALAEQREKEAERRLHSSGGGGTSGGMEPRIAKLEAHMEHVRAEMTKLASLPVQVARLEEKVAHLPSKGFIVTTTMTGLAFVTALVLFADKLRSLIGG